LLGTLSTAFEKIANMRKPNYRHLLLTAAALAALPLFAVSARAAVGDIYETNNNQILRFHANVPGTYSAGLSNPKGLVFDGNGHLFVAEASRGTVVRYNVPDAAGVTILTGLNSPVGLAFDANGNLFVGESGNGTITKVAVDGTQSAFALGLGNPAGLAAADNGNLFVADFAGGNIFQVTPGGAKSTFATGLNLPAGLAFDTSGNLFVADSGTGTIFKYAPDGAKSTFATGLGRPYGLAFEASGDLIVSDNENGSTFRYSPAGVQSVIFSNDFNTPQFVAIEPASHLLLNISTRGAVLGGERVLIAGFVVSGNGPVGTTVVVRALGPSLSTSGITDPLPDPALEVRDSSGNLVASNNDWSNASPEQIAPLGFMPTNSREAALKLTLRGGAFTAIVTNSGGTTGIALVEVYSLQ
jgi:sugar lactone lactonase YvrE